MESLKQFLAREDIKKIKSLKPDELFSLYFNRDPLRVIYYDPFLFYSPADGFILYAKVVEPDKNIVNVKGINYSINHLLKDEIKEECIVVGIFMCVLDVHINRMPTDGYLSYKNIDALKVENLPMRDVEKDILDQLEIKYRKIRYALYNERVVNRIFYPKINHHYYILQIADLEVDVIAHFNTQQNVYYNQGNRFSIVRMGSQVDLIVPYRKNYELLVEDKITYHVEAGVDGIIRIN